MTEVCNGNAKRLCSLADCEKCFKRSFASHPRSKFWHPDNNIDPRYVFLGTHKKYRFICDKCEHIFESALGRVSNKKDPRWCPYCGNNKLCSSNNCKSCFSKSFASHPKSKYWCFDNKKSSREVFLSSHEKYKFQCETCFHIFESALNNTIHSRWCPYCSNDKLCTLNNCKTCFSKSFASHSKSKFWHPDNKVSPREAFLNANEKYKFQCNLCFHIFESVLYIITHKICPSWCPYCSKPPKRLCTLNNCKTCFSKSFASHPKSKFWHPDNKVSSREAFLSSHEKYKFQCDKEPNHIFISQLNNVSKGIWCPWCKNKTEDKLYKWLIDNSYTVTRQPKFDWCRNPKTNKHLPFDFLIDDSIIIELDGAQHFEQVSNWQSPLVTQTTDRYKERMAKENGYIIIRLLQEQVWDDTSTTYVSPNGKTTVTTWQNLLTMVLQKKDKLDTSETVFITTNHSWPGIHTSSYIIKVRYESSIRFV